MPRIYRVIRKAPAHKPTTEQRLLAGMPLSHAEIVARWPDAEHEDRHSAFERDAIIEERKLMASPMAHRLQFLTEPQRNLALA